MRKPRDLAKAASKKGAELFNAVLATDFARPLDRWLGHAFASRATIYDKAMDRTYLETHVWGGDHRLVDGGHDLLGAWRACLAATPDDPFLHTVAGYFSAVWKDLVTPRGLPVVTWDAETFTALSHTMQDTLGVSSAWVKDMASVTATEALGAATGALAVALHWNAADARRFAGLVGSLGLSGSIGANPILLAIALACLAQAFERARRTGNYAEVARGFGRGSIGTGSFLAATATIGGPFWVVIVAGILISILAKLGYDRALEQAEKIDWRGSARFVVQFLRSYAAALKRRGLHAARKPDDATDETRLIGENLVSLEAGVLGGE